MHATPVAIQFIVTHATPVANQIIIVTNATQVALPPQYPHYLILYSSQAIEPLGRITIPNFSITSHSLHLPIIPIQLIIIIQLSYYFNYQLYSQSI